MGCPRGSIGIGVRTHISHYLLPAMFPIHNATLADDFPR